MNNISVENAILSRRYIGLSGICIASFLGCIDLTVVNTIIPAISREFVIPLTSTQWVMSIFIIALSAFMVPAGTIADNYGHKKTLLWGLVIFGVASLIVGLASNIEILVVFRFIQGIGCAILYTVSGAIISFMFNEREKGKALGILFGANGLGLAIGPIVGGLFSGLINWRYAFLINIPFVIISFILCFWSISKSKVEAKNTTKLDITGCLLLAIFLICLVGFFSLNENLTLRMSLFVLVLIALLLFARHEWKTSTPIIEFHFFKNALFQSALLSTFFLAFFYSIVLLTIPLLFSGQWGISDVETGLFLLPATVMFAITSPWVGNYIERYTAKRIILMGLLLFAVSAVLLSLSTITQEPGWFVPGLVLFGIGWGAILGPSTYVALSAFPPEQAAVAMGTAWTIHNVGGACGIAFAVFLLSQFDVFITGYQTIMLTMALLAVICFFICLRLNRHLT
ncbi:MFS transporter [Xenorhabdus bovienii]|uniref:Major facilitator transporter n=1 Tax=Xenorhabdus bovienii str. puntauvense TaxID=1398201 RepID=A0A077NEL2_XENBV|nr:MFS transporter [Xenorhabdus bovienii]CDG87387.1 Major facilitator transporter [Xenorhabdus bovienii str. feltiae France]CDG91733.1 Major facilitator transporter [Xenorhabdus bovienii str. feltiae Florida]CDG96848.1 Major facilitator transporter [Xenorhabdus bovienii str. puntauvense]